MDMESSLTETKTYIIRQFHKKRVTSISASDGSKVDRFAKSSFLYVFKNWNYPKFVSENYWVFGMYGSNLINEDKNYRLAWLATIQLAVKPGKRVRCC